MHGMRKHIQNRSPKQRRRRPLPHLRSQLQNHSQRRENHVNRIYLRNGRPRRTLNGAPVMPIWEYKVIPIKTRIRSNIVDGASKPIIEDVQNDLDVWGKEGWELVTVQDTTLQDGRRYTVAYLKRQKQPQ